MATERTVADLFTQISTLWPDNTTGDISPADLRSVIEDFIESSRKGHTHVTLTNQASPATAVVVTPDTFVMPTGGTTLATGSFGFTKTADFKIRYDRTVVRPLITLVTMSLAVNVNNTIVEIAFLKDDVLLAETESNTMFTKIASTTDIQLITVSTDIEWDQNEELELVMTADKAVTITISSLNWQVLDLFV